jgi:uncharacterized Zn finger protein (UPF0148 family)
MKGVVQATCPGCGAPHPLTHDFREATCAFCQRHFLVDEATMRAFRQARKQRRGRRKQSVRQLESSVSNIDDTPITGAAIAVCFIYFVIGIGSVLMNQLSITPLFLRMIGAIGLTLALAVPHELGARWRLYRFWSDMPQGSRERIRQLSELPRDQWSVENTAELERLQETAKQMEKRHEAGCVMLTLSLLLFSTPLWVWWVAGVLIEGVANAFGMTLAD